MRKLQASDNVVYRTLQAPKISGIFRKNSGKFPTFYFSGKVTTLLNMMWSDFHETWRVDEACAIRTNELGFETDLDLDLNF